MHGLVGQRSLERNREVPAHENTHEQRPRDERVKEASEQRAHRRRLEDRYDDAPPDRSRDAAYDRDDGRAKLYRRDGHEQQQHVLAHVREEEVIGQCVERAGERDEDGAEPEVERKRSPTAMDAPALEAAQAARVEEGSQRDADEYGGVRAPCQPERTGHDIPRAKRRAGKAIGIKRKRSASASG